MRKVSQDTLGYSTPTETKQVTGVEYHHDPIRVLFVHRYELRTFTVSLRQLQNVLRRVRKVAKSAC